MLHEVTVGSISRANAELLSAYTVHVKLLHVATAAKRQT